MGDVIGQSIYQMGFWAEWIHQYMSLQTDGLVDV